MSCTILSLLSRIMEFTQRVCDPPLGNSLIMTPINNAISMPECCRCMQCSRTTCAQEALRYGISRSSPPQLGSTGMPPQHQFR